MLVIAAQAGAAQTGTPVPALAAVDGVMEQALSRYGVKGGAVAVVKNGHLIFARGYGLADVEAQQPVQPDSLFRWCSISKTITAAALMHLVAQGRLDLDSPVFQILDQYSPYNGRWGDNRLRSITVRQLLHHTAGWDRATSAIGDPVVAEGTVKAASAVGGGFPPTLDTVIRYVLAQPLQFSPGTRFAYSNFGYELLRRVIEKVSGQTYADYVRESVLEPVGLTRMRRGAADLAGRLPGEVKYYDYAGASLVNSYVSAIREKQPFPYGVLNPELGEASAAWVGSVVDLAKLAASLDGKRRPALVTAATFSAMVEEQPRETWVDSSGWYGAGLFVQPQADGVTWNHAGYNPGSASGMWRFANGLGIAFLFNGATKDGAYPTGFVAQALWDALDAVSEWPVGDEFPQYFGPRIAAGGVLNAASLQAGALAPAALTMVMGSDLDGGTGVWLRDAGGVERAMEVSGGDPARLETMLPADAGLGDATLVVRREGWPDAEAPLPVVVVSPGLFTLNGDGLAAAAVLRTKRGPGVMPWMAGPVWEAVYQLDENGATVARPIAFGGEDEELTLILYGTGIRGQGELRGVVVRIGDLDLPAGAVGAQMQIAGLDQIQVTLPRTLAGAGAVAIRVDMDGTMSNTVSLTFR